MCVPGVLRGIDMVRGLYFLLTPVDPSILRKVNCLLLGAISLPPCILTTQVRSQVEFYFNLTNYTFLSSGSVDKNIRPKLSVSPTSQTFCVCSSLGLREKGLMSPLTTVSTSPAQESCESSRGLWDPAKRGCNDFLYAAAVDRPLRCRLVFRAKQRFSLWMYRTKESGSLPRSPPADEDNSLLCFWTSMSCNLLLYIRLMALWRSFCFLSHGHHCHTV